MLARYFLLKRLELQYYFRKNRRHVLENRACAKFHEIPHVFQDCGKHFEATIMQNASELQHLPHVLFLQEIRIYENEACKKEKVVHTYHKLHIYTKFS